MREFKFGKKFGLALLVITLLIGSGAASAQDYRHSIGFGAHYFYALGEIEEDWEFEDAGLGYNVSYRFSPQGPLAFEFMAQAYPAGFYLAEKAYAPKLFVLLGRPFYIGLGFLFYHYTWNEDGKRIFDNSSEWSDLSYQARAGLIFPIFGRNLKLDINANYHFNTWDWDEVEDFDEDSLEFGAGLRLYF